MSHDFAHTELEELLTRTREAIEASFGNRSPQVEVRGEGTDPDGHVRAVAVSGGRIETVEFAPQAVRLGSHRLAECALAAVNAALADLEAKAAEAAGLTGPQADALRERLREMQDLSLQQLRSYSRSLQDLMNSFERS